METKICTKCGVEKTIDNFAYRYDTKKYRNECKECKRNYDKNYREKNKERLEYLRKLRYDKDKKREYDKEYYRNNKEKIKQYRIKYRNSSPKRKDYEKQYREKNKERIKQYHLEHRIQINKNNKAWQERNKEKMKEIIVKKYLRERNDPVLRLKMNLRNMVKDAFKRKKYKKSKKLDEICGCSIDYLIEHLIKTYEENYSTKWNWNFAKDVHIDHKIPLATAKTEEDVIRLCHYTNLQLLKAEDNLKKGSKIC